MHSNLKPSNILIPSSETLYIVALIKIYQSGWLLVVGILQGSPNLSYWRLVGDILYSCISGTIAEFFFSKAYSFSTGAFGCQGRETGQLMYCPAVETA